MKPPPPWVGGFCRVKIILTSIFSPIVLISAVLCSCVSGYVVSCSPHSISQLDFAYLASSFWEMLFGRNASSQRATKALEFSIPCLRDVWKDPHQAPGMLLWQHTNAGGSVVTSTAPTTFLPWCTTTSLNKQQTHASSTGHIAFCRLSSIGRASNWGVGLSTP